MLVHVLKSEEDAKALWDDLRRTWRVAAEAGTPVVVTLHEYADKRTEAQNRYFWRLMRFISKYARIHNGHFSADAWAEHFKRSLLGTTIGPKGKEIPVPSHDLTIPEYSKFLAAVEQNMQDELGLDINDMDT